ncbi:Methyltranfer-dom domain-containing protein [Aphelenchoides besseyi]|nr:Methyltranfer-dom domain-containing protein [Aphelenchoides besseyi]KAI6193263.1 Methyltranfer-dom domain-containing protein [Aphelenchoides besseyi]
MRTFYDLLKSAEDCTAQQLKAAYHHRLRQLHPDKTVGNSIEEFVLLQTAFRTLGDEKLRKSYDFWLREQRLRENQFRVDRQIELRGNETEIVEDCRCGATFEISIDELNRIVDYALFECDSCSLQLKMNRQAEDKEEVEESVLGTKEYWDQRYESELKNFKESGTEETIWFGKVAENRILEFLTTNLPKSSRIIDLGCAGGSILKKLHSRGFTSLCGADYSEKAIELARESSTDLGIDYQVADLAADQTPVELCGRFDCVLDKGTWDAMSLSRESKIEAYRRTIVELFDQQNDSVDRFFVLISCNFTVDELKSQFLCDTRLRFHCELPSKQRFTFGGKSGQTTSGIVFRFC